MRLYLVQHGDALSKDVDTDRPLSDRGQEDIRQLAEWLSRRNVRIGTILHSGKTRAEETAEKLRTLLESHGEVSKGEGLGPNDSPDAFLRRLRDSDKDTLIAGHMPFVARTVSQALTGAPEPQLVEFHPGSVAGMERRDDDSWRLFLFARPEFLRREI